jgi:hypothetical protein
MRAAAVHDASRSAGRSDPNSLRLGSATGRYCSGTRPAAAYRARSGTRSQARTPCRCQAIGIACVHGRPAGCNRRADSGHRLEPPQYARLADRGRVGHSSDRRCVPVPSGLARRSREMGCCMLHAVPGRRGLFSVGEAGETVAGEAFGPQAERRRNRTSQPPGCDGLPF